MYGPSGPKYYYYGLFAIHCNQHKGGHLFLFKSEHPVPVPVPATSGSRTGSNILRKPEFQMELLEFPIPNFSFFWAQKLSFDT